MSNLFPFCFMVYDIGNAHEKTAGLDAAEKIVSYFGLYTKENRSKAYALLRHGDPDENRTRITAVKGRCLNRLTTGPYGSGNRT